MRYLANTSAFQTNKKAVTCLTYSFSPRHKPYNRIFNHLFSPVIFQIYFGVDGLSLLVYVFCPHYNFSFIKKNSQDNLFQQEYTANPIVSAPPGTGMLANPF
jgi:hypothetical protein